MSSSSLVLIPLSDSDKEIIRLSLQNEDMKIYTVASVSLLFMDKTKDVTATNMLGTLVLFRTGPRLVLRLLDISVSPSITKWQHDLTSGAAIVETEQDGEKRTYALTDTELDIKCVFADDEEASKFISKFLRTVDKAQKATTSMLQPEGNPSRLHLDELEEQTIRGTTTLDGSRLAIPGNRPTGLSNREDKKRQGTSESISQNEKAAKAPPGVDVTSGSLHDTTKQNGSEEGQDSDAWECTVGGRTYRIPDLTNKLSQLPLHNSGTSESRHAGGFGTVCRAQLKDGTEVAIKTLFRKIRTPANKTDLQVRMKERKRFKNEAAMQSVLKHSNVLPLLGIAESEESGLGASLVLPWMKNLNSRTYVGDNPQVRRLPLILGTIRGVAYLHSQGFVHGDIKARNILISDNGEPLLSDFGLTSFVEMEDREVSETLAQAGSLLWMSPELLQSHYPGRSVTKYSDIWAFSMTIIELLTGKPPLYGGIAYPVVSNYERGLFPKRPQSNECSDKLWELVLDCWKRDPSCRPSAEAARCIIEIIAGTNGANF